MDRDQVRSLLEIGVQGGDDPRIDHLNYHIQRPRRRATPAEIAAGDWSVLPRGPWEPLKRTTARSIVLRDVALGGYRVRARFLGRRRRSAWTSSPPALADGKSDSIDPPAGLGAVGVAEGYWAYWNPSTAPDYAYSEIYDRVGEPGPPTADVLVSAAGWTYRGGIAGTGFTRAGVIGTDALRVAVRHVDTSEIRSEAREVGVTPKDPADGIPGAAGEDGLPGEDGENAPEYVFAAYADEALPANRRPSNDWGFDEPGTVNGLTWHDAAPDLSPAYPRLLRAQRRPPRGALARGQAVADQWTVPTVIARYGVDGVEGGDGSDGNGAPEYAFAAWSSDSVPASKRPLDTWGFDELNAGPVAVDGLNWHDGASPELTPEASYLMRAERDVIGNPAIGDAVAALWSAPVAVGRFGADGEDALPSPGPVTISGSYSRYPLGGLDVQDNAITVEWTEVAEADNYTVVLEVVGGVAKTVDPGEAGPTQTFHLFSEQIDSPTIVVEVYAVQIVDGNELVSGPALASGTIDTTPPPRPPATPTGLSGSVSDDDIAVEWNASTGATSYRLQRRLGTSGAWATIATAAQTSYSDLNLADGSYWYRVQSRNSNGSSDYSAAAGPFTVEPAPAAAWGAWGAPAVVTPPILADIDDVAAGVRGVQRWDDNTADVWVGAATTGWAIRYTALGASVVFAQSLGSAANNMRYASLDPLGWHGTYLPWLNLMPEDLDDPAWRAAGGTGLWGMSGVSHGPAGRPHVCGVSVADAGDGTFRMRLYGDAGGVLTRWERDWE